MVSDSARDRMSEVGIIDRAFRVSSKVVNAMTKSGEKTLQLFLHSIAAMIGSDRDRPWSEPGQPTQDSPSQRAAQPPPGRPSELSRPAFQMASTRSPRLEAAWSATPGGARQGRPTGARQPRSAFTVVEANETITDVALRVYGTADEVDALWRANRDALPRQDSRLSPGTLLRTPTVR